MCFEYYERRRREADESRQLWRDFERTEPVREPELPDEPTESPVEAREDVATVER
jgi:hypothetical protein